MFDLPEKENGLRGKPWAEETESWNKDRTKSWETGSEQMKLFKKF